MDAWEILSGNSTLGSGDAWEHLNAQDGDGGGDTIIIGGDAQADATWAAAADVIDILSANCNNVEMSADIAEILAADVENIILEAEVCP